MTGTEDPRSRLAEARRQREHEERRRKGLPDLDERRGRLWCLSPEKEEALKKEAAKARAEVERRRAELEGLIEAVPGPALRADLAEGLEGLLQAHEAALSLRIALASAPSLDLPLKLGEGQDKAREKAAAEARIRDLGKADAVEAVLDYLEHVRDKNGWTNQQAIPAAQRWFARTYPDDGRRWFPRSPNGSPGRGWFNKELAKRSKRRKGLA